MTATFDKLTTWLRHLEGADEQITMIDETHGSWFSSTFQGSKYFHWSWILSMVLQLESLLRYYLALWYWAETTVSVLININHQSLNNRPSNSLFCKSPHGHIDWWNTSPGSSHCDHLTLPWIWQPLCVMSLSHPSHLSSAPSFQGLKILSTQWPIHCQLLISYQELPMHTGEWSSIRLTTFYLQWYCL